MGVSVRVDWMVLFGIISFIFVVMIFVSWSIYLSIEKNSVFSEEDEKGINPLHVNTEQLDRVVNNLNSRKEKFNSL